MPSSPPTEIQHDALAHRFTLDLNGTQAVLDYRELDAQTLDYFRTFVPNALRGGGLASRLTDHALRYAREHGLKIVPTCPFIATYIERHSEFQSLLR